jgi:DNA excision repair protein ERCC-1
LTFVDIPNHEDALRELSKTSVVNNVTIILCWSAAEAARYLELYKSYEHAGFSAIQGQRNSGYADRLIEFVTVPRGINKADAVALVSNFGSLRNAINADAQQLGMIGGWGETKVKRWCSAVQEPFRARNAAARRLEDIAHTQRPSQIEAVTAATSSAGTGSRSTEELPSNSGEAPSVPLASPHSQGQKQKKQDLEMEQPLEQSTGLAPGIAAALSRLREDG